MSSSPEHKTAIIYKALVDRSVPPAEALPPAECADTEIIRKLYGEVLALRETLKSFAKGDFSISITNRGAVWGHLKTLQANMQHLAWQVTQVAEGDLSQRVDFMGDFSTAFNKMALQLEDSLEKMKEQESAERTQVMLDATPLGCCLCNEQYELIDCNLEAVRLFEMSNKKEFIERFFELMPEYQPDGSRSVEIVQEKIHEALEKGYAQCEFMHQKLNGELLPSEVMLVRVLQKKHYIVASYIRDLRELKRQQSELEQQRLLLLNIFSSSPICFTIIVDGKLKFVSPFMQQFLGVGIGEHFIDCFVCKKKGVDLFEAVKKDVHFEWEPVTLCSKENGNKEMLANIFTTDYYGEQGIIVWLVDITELKKIESDLRAAKETAEYLARVKDEFLANMSHELRTPMNAVFGILHLLHDTQLSSEQEEHVNTMEQSSKHLLRLIDNILDFSKLESGKVIIESDDFDLRQTFTNVLSLLQDAASAKGLSLSLSIDSGVPTKIIGDQRRLQQILLSLTDNAINFSSQGTITLRGQLESAADDKIVLRFSVQDMGIGINAEAGEKIFQPFSQADGSMSRQYGGIGLGLAVVKNLVEAMKGKIWYESERQKGTTFFFTATFKLSKTNEISTDSLNSLQGMPILLAEDNRINQIVAVKLLQAKGMNVDVAANGLQAVEMVKQKDYALVLMDLQMPEMDGIQATLKIKSDEKFASLPIIALSANAMEDDKQQCLRAGMKEHIAKPIDPKVLYQVILKWAKPPTPNS